MNDTRQLRTTFDSAAALYQRARPEYPDALYDTLVELTALEPSDWLLEVGCGSGKAALPLARRGFRITCIELGSALAAVARETLRDFPGVEVVKADFEKWQPAHGARFELVFAATAWHWIDPAKRYQHAWELLRPGGHLAFWSAVHVFPDRGDPFFAEIQKVYEEIGGAPPGCDVSTSRRASRRARRDRAHRALPGRRRPPIRSGDHLRRRQLSAPARHLFGSYCNGTLAS